MHLSPPWMTHLFLDTLSAAASLSCCSLAAQEKKRNKILPFVRFQYELREGKRRKMEQERREREERERKEREEQERQEQLERIRRQEEEEIRRREEEEARRRSEEREAAERARQGDEVVVSVEAEGVSRLPNPPVLAMFIWFVTQRFSPLRDNVMEDSSGIFFFPD